MVASPAIRRSVLVLLLIAAATTLQAQGPVRKIGEMELALVGLSATLDSARPAIPKNVASGVKIIVSAGGTPLAPGAVARLVGAFSVEGELSGPLGPWVLVALTGLEALQWMLEIMTEPSHWVDVGPVWLSPVLGAGILFGALMRWRWDVRRQRLGKAVSTA